MSAIIGGVVNIATGFTGGRRWSAMILGAIQLIVGVWLLLHPLTGMLALIPAFGLVLIVSGVVSIAAAFRFS